MLTDEGPVAIDVPRDRAGTLEPQLIPKREPRFTGFDDKAAMTRQALRYEARFTEAPW